MTPKELNKLANSFVERTKQSASLTNLFFAFGIELLTDPRVKSSASPEVISGSDASNVTFNLKELKEARDGAKKLKKDLFNSLMQVKKDLDEIEKEILNVERQIEGPSPQVHCPYCGEVLEEGVMVHQCVLEARGLGTKVLTPAFNSADMI